METLSTGGKTTRYQCPLASGFHLFLLILWRSGGPAWPCRRSGVPAWPRIGAGGVVARRGCASTREERRPGVAARRRRRGSGGGWARRPGRAADLSTAAPLHLPSAPASSRSGTLARLWSPWHALPAAGIPSSASPPAPRRREKERTPREQSPLHSSKNRGRSQEGEARKKKEEKRTSSLTIDCIECMWD
ncbi:hypothetical protein PVAP13_3NG201326 [Panicum virgatum]|uniref:Uncharacterized protein n=1 Tax=Panicum virgatum TaxID=38727 RepID=A0A8T0UDL0_PANVG|nr:hypothetical protein PVAP13_3NG201326 [Panicum virgatum]